MSIYIKHTTILYCLLLSLNLSAQLYELEKLGTNINTDTYDEITPVVSKDGKTLCFTRMGYPIFDRTLMESKQDRSKDLSKRKYHKYLAKVYSDIAGYTIYDPEDSKFNQDIWIAKSYGKEFNLVIHPTYPLNNALPNSICAITPDGNSVIVINHFLPDGGMRKGFSISHQLPNDKWSFPQPIYIEDYENIDTDVGLTLSNDGNILILTMVGADSHGGNDLYVSFRTGKYSWSSPLNMGSVINTPNRETTPFLTVDNQTLYFATDRAGGQGGSDIFYTKRLDNTWKNWSEPKPMDAPINSEADDSQPFYNTLDGYLYFTSKRHGSSDIFRVRIEKPVKETVTIVGRVYNPKTDETIPKAMIKHTDQGVEYYEDLVIAEDGTYSFEIPKGVTYDLIAEKYEHVGEKKTIEFKKNYLYFRDYEVNLILRPIEVGSKINLKAIYFEQSTANILEKSYPALDELAAYLKEHKSFYVRIEGHTDNQGSEADLKKLSQQRAEAIKEYLVYEKFIKPVRLDAIGLGGEQAVNDNSTEELRAQNRRVEVTIMTISRIIERPKSDTSK